MGGVYRVKWGHLRKFEAKMTTEKLRKKIFAPKMRFQPKNMRVTHRQLGTSMPFCRYYFPSRNLAAITNSSRARCRFSTAPRRNSAARIAASANDAEIPPQRSHRRFKPGVSKLFLCPERCQCRLRTVHK